MSFINSFAVGTNTFPLNYIPAAIEFRNLAATSSASLLQIEADDYGQICNLDTNGIADIGRLKTFGDDDTNVIIPIATGKIPLSGSQCRITITAVTAAIRVYQRSGNAVPDALLIKNTMSTALANSESVYDKFTFLGLRNLNVAALLTIVYANGHVESNLSPAQVQQMLKETMGGILAPDLATPAMISPSVLDNRQGIYSKVYVTAPADTTIYIQRLQSRGAITQK